MLRDTALEVQIDVNVLREMDEKMAKIYGKMDYVVRRREDEMHNNFELDEIEVGRLNFLRSRWNVFHNKMNGILNSIVRNTAMVAVPWDGVIILEMLMGNWLVRSPDQNDIVFVEMELGKCHDNVEQLYDECQIEESYEGYALSRDGLWRHHSWGVDGEGKIVETTEKRLCYVAVDKN